jgi:hypothetical protein
MRVTFIALSSTLVACLGTPDDSGNDVDLEQATCVTTNQQSLIETDTTTIVTEANFGLHKVLDRIRLTTPTSATAPVSFPSSALPMFQEIYAAFNDCTSSATIDPNHYGLPCRTESILDNMNPFPITSAIHYRPVAVVNRFDLAPSDFSYCGESRIVFWKTPSVSGRAAIIVEMRTPAVVQNGIKTCVPVAQFWANLSTITDPATRASKLVSFYFNGLPGMPFPPVSARGAGFGGAGQVRLNSFVEDQQWNLREFKWQKVCTTSSTGVVTCSAHFVEQTTKNNPSQLLFSGANSKAPAFQSWFVSNAVPRLAAATDVNALALGNANSFNTFESVSQPFPSDPTSVQYGSFASTALRGRIQTELTSLHSTLTVDQILARAETQTCGGCHEVSNGAALGGGLTWPFSGGFVQVDEQGTLSQAMTTQFLPHRKSVLEGFLCNPPAATADPSTTIDGVPAGAAN